MTLQTNILLSFLSLCAALIYWILLKSKLTLSLQDSERHLSWTVRLFSCVTAWITVNLTKYSLSLFFTFRASNECSSRASKQPLSFSLVSKFINFASQICACSAKRLSFYSKFLLLNTDDLCLLFIKNVQIGIVRSVIHYFWNSWWQIITVLW